MAKDLLYSFIIPPIDGFSSFLTLFFLKLWGSLTVKIRRSPTPTPKAPPTIQAPLHPTAEIRNGIKNLAASPIYLAIENAKNAFVLYLSSKNSVTNWKKREAANPWEIPIIAISTCKFHISHANPCRILHTPQMIWHIPSVFDMLNP